MKPPWKGILLPNQIQPSGHFWPGRGGAWQPVERLPGWRVFCGTGVMDDTIHVWCIYLRLVVFNGKIWSMQVNISYMDAMIL